MNPFKFYTLLALSIVGLILTATVMAIGHSNDELNTGMQAKQQDINKGSMSQQIGSNLLRDIAQNAANDSKLRDVLSQNGFALRSGTNAATPPSSPAPPSVPSSTP